RVSQGLPVRGEQRIETLEGAGLEQRLDHEDHEQHNEQWNEDLGNARDSPLDSAPEHKQSEGPHEHERNEHAEHGFGDRGEVLRVLQEIPEEEPFRVVTPCFIHRESDETNRPTDDHGVVDRDEETDPYVPPADALDPAVQPPVAQRGGTTELVADRVVHEQQRNPRGEERYQIGNDECAPTALICDIRKTPDVP